MRFALPAAASPGAQAALLGGCREVARAGGHAVAEPALALFAWELGEAVLTAFRCSRLLGVARVVCACLDCYLCPVGGSL